MYRSSKQFRSRARKPQFELLEDRRVLSATPTGHFVRVDGVLGDDVSTSASAFARAWSYEVPPYDISDGPYPDSDSDELLARVFPDATVELGSGFGNGITQTLSQLITPIGETTSMPTVSMVTQELTFGAGSANFEEEGPYWNWSGGKGTVATRVDLIAEFEYVDTTPEVGQEFFGGLYLVGAGGGVADAVAVTEWAHETGMGIQVWKNRTELLANVGATGNGSGGYDQTFYGAPLEGEPGSTLWNLSGYVGEESIAESSSQLNAFISFTTPLQHGDRILFVGSIESEQDSYTAVFSDEGSYTTQAVFGEAINAFGFAYKEGDPPTPPTPDPTPSPFPSPQPPLIGPPAPGDLDNDGDIDDDDAMIFANDPSILVVTTENDESDGDFSYFDLSLREAIGLAQDANHPGPDTIVFAPWVHHIGLDIGQLTIISGNDVAIVGPGVEKLTIDGINTSRVFQINSGANVEIHDLVIQDGYTTGNGGGILNQGNLTLDGIVIDDNTANTGGGIYSAGTLGVYNSTITNNSANTGGGGGIYTTGFGQANIINSTIDHNTGYYGGAIRVDQGRLYMRNSTLSTNQGFSGGGLSVTGTGTSYVQVYHSTIAFNTAPNGGGIWLAANQPYSHVQHTIVAHNTGGQVTGTFYSSSYNLISATAGLLSLAENGGSTQTHALDSSSPAIDSGSPTAIAGSGTVPLYDQRGFGYSRVVDGDGMSGARIDIGAFEYAPPPGAGSAMALAFASAPEDAAGRPQTVPSPATSLLRPFAIDRPRKTSVFGEPRLLRDEAVDAALLAVAAFRHDRPSARFSDEQLEKIARDQAASTNDTASEFHLVSNLFATPAQLEPR